MRTEDASINESAFLSASQQQNQLMSERTKMFLESLQGQSRLAQYRFLIINYLKVIFLCFPLALTVVGFILILHFKKLRLYVIYSTLEEKNIHKAKYIYCESQDKVIEFCLLKKKNIKGEQKLVFTFHNLKYEVIGNKPYPLSLKIEEIQSFLSQNSFNRGLSTQEYQQNKNLFGQNEHAVQLPSYIKFLIAVLIHPFSLIAYFTGIIYVLLKIAVFTYILLGSMFLTMNINFYLTRQSFKKIKKMAENSFKVKTLRNGQFIEVNSEEIVPFDVYIPGNEVPCDSILIKQDLFVSEVGFTGENIPIAKFEPPSYDKIMNKEHWILEGCQIITSKPNCLALAINTGYSSSKGRIIRKILTTKATNVQFFKKLMYQAIQIVVLNVTFFFVAFSYTFANTDDEGLILLKFGEFVMEGIPSYLVVYVNFLCTFSLNRLNNLGVISTQSQKIVEGSRVQLFCFDKTGTLTEKQVQFHSFIELSQKEERRISDEQLIGNQVLTMILASCNSVKKLGQTMRGDQIDLAMFEKVGSKILESQSPGILWEIQTSNLHLQILKINQFESKFQSMSVLVRNKRNKELYVFAKGAPELIHSFSLKKCQHFDKIIKDLSLKGFRTVAVSVKKIKEDSLEQCYQWERHHFLEDTQILGLATFTNRPKPEAYTLISTLLQAELDVKMITGDNIFVAVQASLTLGFVQDEKPILILEGHQVRDDNSILGILITKRQNKIREEQIEIRDIDNFDYSEYWIAVDSTFLKKRQHFNDNDNILIYARATPEMKTIVVTNQKEKIMQKYKQRTVFKKLFGRMIQKVAMVGDGANDLMAIKEADIGIAISNSDAMHSSDFAIQNLSFIELILRECKCTQKNIIELSMYVASYYFNYNIYNIYLTHDMSNYEAKSSLFKNFTCTYPFAMLMAFFPAAKTLTKYRPSLNLIGLENQLHFFGTIILTFIGVTISYKYYQNSPDFEPNTDHSHLNQHTKTSTIIMLISTIIMFSTNFAMVGSHPWKQNYWKNKAMMVVLVFNLVINPLFVTTSWFGWLGYQKIDPQYGGITYLIAFGFGILIVLYNELIRRLKLYKKPHL